MHQACAAVKSGCKTLSLTLPQARQAKPIPRKPFKTSSPFVARFAGVAHRWGVGPNPLSLTVAKPKTLALPSQPSAILGSSPVAGRGVLASGGASSMARTAARSTALAAHRSREGSSQTPEPKRVRFSLSPSSENIREEDPDPGFHTKLYHSAGDPHPTDGKRGEDGSDADPSLGDHTSRQAMPIAYGTVSLGDEGIERCRGVHPKETKGEEGSATPAPTSPGHP